MSVCHVLHVGGGVRAGQWELETGFCLSGPGPSLAVMNDLTPQFTTSAMGLVCQHYVVCPGARGAIRDDNSPEEFETVLKIPIVP